jgi:hypothetical protein
LREKVPAHCRTAYLDGSRRLMLLKSALVMGLGALADADLTRWERTASTTCRISDAVKGSRGWAYDGRALGGVENNISEREVVVWTMLRRDGSCNR